MTDRRQGEHQAIFDFHPVTGASFEVFYADRTLESFGWRGAGWLVAAAARVRA
jgi:hypothetical protein